MASRVKSAVSTLVIIVKIRYFVLTGLSRGLSKASVIVLIRISIIMTLSKYVLDISCAHFMRNQLS